MPQYLTPLFVCSAKYAPELNEAEVKAGLEMLDKNGDGSIQLSEFTDWWLSSAKKAAA